MNTYQSVKMKQKMSERFEIYINRIELLKNEETRELNANRVLETKENINEFESQWCLPRYIYHASYQQNREHIMLNGIRAFGNRCFGVYASVPLNFDPLIANDFYPSINGDTNLADDRFDFWQIDRYKLPRFTWFSDDYTPSDKSHWVFTLNNIPAFALRLYKVKISGSDQTWKPDVSTFVLYPITSVNNMMSKNKREYIKHYF